MLRRKKTMLALLSKSSLTYIGFVVILVVLLAGVYYAGSRSATTEFIREEAKEFQDTTDAVNRGLNEVRRANPNRDASIALERLRERQSER